MKKKDIKKKVNKNQKLKIKEKIWIRIIRTWINYENEKNKKKIKIIIRYIQNEKKKKKKIKKKDLKRVCILTERTRSVYRLTMLSRIKTREYASNGYYVGLKKASW